MPRSPHIPNSPWAVPLQARMLAADTNPHMCVPGCGDVSWVLDGEKANTPPPLSSLRLSCHVWCSELRRLGLAVSQVLRASGRDPGAGSAPCVTERVGVETKVALFRTESPTHVLGWTTEHLLGWNSMWHSHQKPETPRAVQSGGPLLRSPLTWHPFGNLVTDKSTSPADKSPEGPGHSRLLPGTTSPDSGPEKELDVRPLGCACAGVWGPLCPLSPNSAWPA